MWWSRRPGSLLVAGRARSLSCMWWSRRPGKPVSGWKSSVLEVYVHGRVDQESLLVAGRVCGGRVDQ